MASASASSSRPSEALADVPAEPSRGHCRDGLLHRAHAYFRHSLLLFHHRPRHGYTWELYNITEDYSEYNDLAAKNPDKLKELQALFLKEAAQYQVFPLDNSLLARVATPRPSATAGQTVFTYVGENSNISVANSPSLLDKDYTITAEVTIPDGGAEGMIATMGGRFGGYALMLSPSASWWLSSNVAKAIGVGLLLLGW